MDGCFGAVDEIGEGGEIVFSSVDEAHLVVMCIARQQFWGSSFAHSSVRLSFRRRRFGGPGRKDRKIYTPMVTGRIKPIKIG